tara:strand:- start:96 stop:347 length:252 start_codon:yes stop_codon:yes gene_type:complete
MDTLPREKVEMIVKTAILGEHSRGNHGAVLLDGNEIVYLLVDEFKPTQFADQLTDLLTDDNHQHYFVVVKTDSAMHITKIPKY